jgi:uncharacterized protein (TIGR02118 family)
LITRIGMAPRRKGLTGEAFQAHWRGRHGDLAARLPGVRRYWQNHALLRDGEPLLPWTGFDACSEIDFDDIATMGAAFKTELYLKDISEDEAWLIEKSKGGLILADRDILHGRVDGAGTRLLTFMRASPGQTAATLQKALGAQKPAAGAVARELLSALPPERADGYVSAFDAVEALWFAGPDEAQRYLLSADARERRADITHLVRGVERLLAQVRIMV